MASCRKELQQKISYFILFHRLSAGGGTGYFVEYCGQAIEALSMEGRMTICNMSIEMGARGGLIAPDEVTFEYLNRILPLPGSPDFKSLLLRWRNSEE